MAAPSKKIIPEAPADIVRSEADMEPHVLIYKGRMSGRLRRGYSGPRYVIMGALRTLLSCNRVMTIEDELVLNTKDFTLAPGTLEIGDIVGAVSVCEADELHVP